jgi:hypothetical protein
MLQTNFDDLELSLELLIQQMKRRDLLQEASRATHSSKSQLQLREQLEDQAQMLNRIKDHHREIRDDLSWPELELLAQKLLNIRTLFSEEESKDFKKFKNSINILITQKLAQLDQSRNEKLIKRSKRQAAAKSSIKNYQNWTSI